MRKVLAAEAQSQREQSERELRVEIALSRDGEEKALAMLTRAEDEKRELLDALLCARAGVCPISSSASLGFADFSQADMLGLRHNPSARERAQMVGDRARTSQSALWTDRVLHRMIRLARVVLSVILLSAISAGT